MPRSEWWWPWLVDVALPLAGIVASTAIAVAAFVASSRARSIALSLQQELRDREFRRERAKFAETLVSHFRSLLRDEPSLDDVKREGTVLGPDAEAIIQWARTEEYVAVIHPPEHNADKLARKRAESALLSDLESRLRVWVSSGRFDFGARPVDPPNYPSD